MSEKIESAKGTEINTKIQEKLKQLLKDDFEVISQDDLSVLNSLDDKDKEILVVLLNEKPEVSKEILDNLPLDVKGLQKLLELIKNNKVILSKNVLENSNPGKQKSELLTTENQNNLLEEAIKEKGSAILEENSNPGKQISKLLTTEKQNNRLEEALKEKRSAKLENEEAEEIHSELKQKVFKNKDYLVKELDLKNNPNYQKYQNEAKEKLLASNPNLEKDKNFSDYVDSYLLIQHQKEFLAGRSDLQASFDTLNKDASRLEVFKNIRIDEYIDRNLKDGTLKREKEQIKASLLPNGEDLQISGNEFKSGDQVTILDKDKGPKKFIEKYSYRIDTSQELETPYKYQYDKDQIITNYNSKRNDYTSKQKTLGQLAQDIKNKEKQINEEGNSLDENASFRKDIFKAELETFLKDFNKLTQDSKQLEQQIKELEKQAQELQTKEDRRIGDYRDSQLERDEKARQTLEFLHNIGFTNISQSDFEAIARIVNSSPSKYGFSRNVDLNEFFEIRPGENPQRPYVEFVNFFNKLLGLEGKDQINVGRVSEYINGNDKGLTGSSFESKVRNTLYSEGSFRFTLIEERFSGKKEK